MSRLLRVALVAALLTLITALTTALPAQAHTELIGSSPGQGETRAKPPAIIALQFSEQVLELGAVVQVTGPGGRADDGRPRLAGAAVVQRLQAGLPAGSYRVVWRVTADDGHPIAGKFSFTARGAGESATPSSSAAAGSSPTASSPAASSPTTVPVEPASGNDSPTPAWTIVGVTIVAAGLIAGLVALLRPRRRTVSSESNPGSNPGSSPDPSSHRQPPGPGPTTPPSD